MATEIEIIKKHLSKDAVLALTLDNPTVEWEEVVEPDVYFSLIRSIVSQQLSVKAAATIFGRFLALFEEQYPKPTVVLQLSLEDLRAVGLSKQKAGYIQNVARFFIENEDKDWATLSDRELVDYLIAIKGIGEWTVQMMLMFTLGREDVLPTADLGVQNAIKRLYNIDAKGKELTKKMKEIAENWTPYRTIACLYLWKWKDNTPN